MRKSILASLTPRELNFYLQYEGIRKRRDAGDSAAEGLLNGLWKGLNDAARLGAGAITAIKYVTGNAPEGFHAKYEEEMHEIEGAEKEREEKSRKKIADETLHSDKGSPLEKTASYDESVSKYNRAEEAGEIGFVAADTTLGIALGGFTNAIEKKVLQKMSARTIVTQGLKYSPYTGNNTARLSREWIPDAIQGGSRRINPEVAKRGVNAAEEIITLSKARFGHTFTTHGDEMTEFLLNRARGSNMPQGQFSDNQAAARFINSNLDKIKNGPAVLPIPENFPARVIMPDGSFLNPTHIKLVPGGNGVKTAYPLILR